MVILVDQSRDHGPSADRSQAGLAVAPSATWMSSRCRGSGREPGPLDPGRPGTRASCSGASRRRTPHELHPDTLETVSERYDFHGGVRGPLTAHFKVDPGNGDILFFGNDNGTITWYRADSRRARPGAAARA
jgi:hypothetical protein